VILLNQRPPTPIRESLRRIWNGLRMVVAFQLMSWTILVLPKTDEARVFVDAIGQAAESQMKEPE